MPRVARLYVPLSVSFFMNDRVLSAGEDCAWLFLRMLTMAKSLDSDGKLTGRQVESLGVDEWASRLDRLVASRLLVIAEQPVDGVDLDTVYVIKSWMKWNESAADRAERLRIDRERKQNSSTRGRKTADT